MRGWEEEVVLKATFSFESLICIREGIMTDFVFDSSLMKHKDNCLNKTTTFMSEKVKQCMVLFR